MGGGVCVCMYRFVCVYVYGCVCMCVYVSPHVDGMLCMHLDYSNMSIPFISLHCLLSQYLQLQKTLNHI